MASRFYRPFATCFLYASVPLVSLNYIRLRLELSEELNLAEADVTALETAVRERTQMLARAKPLEAQLEPQVKLQAKT